MLRSLADRNPLLWMAQVNGLLVDLRDMPREAHEIAFARNIIAAKPAPGYSRGLRQLPTTLGTR